MKKISMLILALCLPLLVLNHGCTTSEQTLAYKTSGAAQVSVDTAMTAWGDYVASQAAAGKPVPDAMRLRVKNAYEKYQAAAILVIDAESALAGTTNSVALETSAAQSLTDLVQLLQTIGVQF